MNWVQPWGFRCWPNLKAFYGGAYVDYQKN